MKKKVTLDIIASQIITTLSKQIAKVDKRVTKLDERMERHFGALAKDIAETATKEQIVSLHMQVNSIEVQLRGHDKLKSRTSDLEEKVFGAARG